MDDAGDCEGGQRGREVGEARQRLFEGGRIQHEHVERGAEGDGDEGGGIEAREEAIGRARSVVVERVQIDHLTAQEEVVDEVYGRERREGHAGPDQELLEVVVHGARPEREYEGDKEKAGGERGPGQGAQGPGRDLLQREAGGIGDGHGAGDVRECDPEQGEGAEKDAAEGDHPHRRIRFAEREAGHEAYGLADHRRAAQADHVRPEACAAGLRHPREAAEDGPPGEAGGHVDLHGEHEVEIAIAGCALRRDGREGRPVVLAEEQEHHKQLHDKQARGDDAVHPLDGDRTAREHEPAHDDGEGRKERDRQRLRAEIRAGHGVHDVCRGASEHDR